MSAAGSSIFIRLAALLLGLGFTGAALAEPNDYDSALKLAACYANAQTQYLTELAQCANDPYRLADCQNMAQLHYALAQAACGGAKAASISMGSDGLKAFPLRAARIPGRGNATAVGPHFPIVVPGGNRHRR